MRQSNEFYNYQQSRFSYLLGWGLLNTVLGGILGLTNPGGKKFYGSFFVMSSGWGFINFLLALSGMRVARQKAKRDLPIATALKDAKSMRNILLVNVPLDVVYIASGCWLILRKDEIQRASGWSNIVQGVWLFAYDSLLALDVQNKWLSQSSLSPSSTDKVSSSK